MTAGIEKLTVNSVGHLTAKRYVICEFVAMQRALTPGVTKMTRTHLFSFKSNRSVDGRSGQRYQIGNVLLLIYFISGPLTSSDRGSLSASPSAGRKGRKGLGNPENIYLVLDRR